jgi:acyl-coenzyme A thioesterase PaaI-like protein
MVRTEDHSRLNGCSRLYGGVVAALADNAMGSRGLPASRRRERLTLSLHLDDVTAVMVGQCLLIAPRVAWTGGTLAFADGDTNLPARQCLIWVRIHRRPSGR